jgi:nucleotide-binding universal stress UspA family protein
MQSQVLVPLDGSTNAEVILPHALFFAQQTHSILTLLRVIMPPGEPVYPVPYIPDDWYGSEVSWTRNYLSTLAGRLASEDDRVQCLHTENVSASTAITSYAEHHPDVRLIALATHGRDAGGRLFLGSVAENVFASAPTSLLVLHPQKDAHLPSGPIPRASYRTIVVPLDGTAPSERVLELATTLALRDHASVLLVSVPPPSLFEEMRVDEIARPLRRVPERQEMKQADFLAEKAEQLHTSTGLTVQTAITAGDPEAFIEALTKENQQKMLVVTTREQAEQKVMRFLHQNNVPVLFITF